MEMNISTVELYILMCWIFFIAGSIQGLFGMGLPVTGITLLSIFIPPVPAIGLNIIPIFLISLFQTFQSNRPLLIISKYKYFAFSMIVSGFFISFLIIYLGDALLLTLLATVVILFSLNNLFGKTLKFNQKFDFYWQLIFGIIAGIIGGLTSIVGLISAMYLAMLKLNPKEFIDGSGFLIFIGCISVGSGYVLMGIIEPFMIGPSLFGTFTAFLGFKLGSFVRKFVSPDNFYKILWIIFLITGFRLAITAISKF